MSFERRTTFRANVVIAVEVRDAHGFSLHGTRDLSSGGLYFDRAIPHSVGSRVQLAFTLPGEAKSIRCDGEVVNVPDKLGFGMGIQFLDIAPQDAESIENFAKELSERS